MARTSSNRIAQPWDLLCNALHGSGVYSLDEALSKLKIRPLLETLQQAISTNTIESFATLSDRPSQVSTETIQRLQGDEIVTDKNLNALPDHSQAVSQLTVFVDSCCSILPSDTRTMFAIDHHRDLRRRKELHQINIEPTN